MSRAVAYAYDLLFDDNATKRRRKRIAMKPKVLVRRLEILRRNIAKGGRRSRIDSCNSGWRNEASPKNSLRRGPRRATGLPNE